jgi:Protein of unknown function (DUF2695)
MTSVLVPVRGDPAWEEFCEALYEALGPALPGLCMGSHYFTERLLEARGFHVAASVALFEKRGGNCDCEVLFNVDASVETPEEEVRP